ncbi:MAG: glycerophosphodiester phosphodiesterase family protein [Anaerolineae bacterium]|jgi:glycerophosphoryl diester phosphodiesterase
MWSDVDRPLNIAHRGASRIAPQNTLAAFRKALEIGVDGIELDVRLCADGVPVVIHDATVDATTDGTGRVDALTLGQLKQLDAGSSFDSSFAGERIPTLAEVLQILGDKLLLNIELKGIGPLDRGLEQVVVDLLQRYSLEPSALLSSFNLLALRRVQQMTPGVSTGLLCARGPLSVTRLGRFFMPEPITALHPHHTIVNRRNVAWARARNLRVHAWTVDDIADMRRLISCGVDGIITNVPDRLQRLLANPRADQAEHRT